MEAGRIMLKEAKQYGYLEKYRAELETRLCNMDDEEPENMAGEIFEQWADAHKILDGVVNKDVI